jgi:sarcosine oxidase, subunit gamma
MSDTAIELSDISGLKKLGLKGPGVAAWLASRRIDLPADIFRATRTSDGGWTVRLGTAEFMLEASSSDDQMSHLEASLESLPLGVYRVPHEEATFLLAGGRTGLVFAQTCGIDFRKAVPGLVIYSRVAGVSCGILPTADEHGLSYRIWLDPSYADYLWETLAGVVRELDGHCTPSPARDTALAH